MEPLAARNADRKQELVSIIRTQNAILAQEWFAFGGAKDEIQQTFARSLKSRLATLHSAIANRMSPQMVHRLVVSAFLLGLLLPSASTLVLHRIGKRVVGRSLLGSRVGMAQGVASHHVRGTIRLQIGSLILRFLRGMLMRFGVSLRRRIATPAEYRV